MKMISVLGDFAEAFFALLLLAIGVWAAMNWRDHLPPYPGPWKDKRDEEKQ